MDGAYAKGDKYLRLHYCSRYKSGELLVYDIELFENTPVWRLAKAVYEQDTETIFCETQRNQQFVHFKDTLYGMTLLKWAVFNRRFFSAKELLKAGADPNMPALYNNFAPIVDAASDDSTSNFFSLLLAHGGNVNFKLNLPSGGEYTVFEAAAAASLENTKIAINAGADVNYSSDGIHTAFSSAVVAGTIETVEYLISKGCRFKGPIEVVDRDTTYAIDAIKRADYRPGTKDYETAQRVLKFLRENGADSFVVD